MERESARVALVPVCDTHGFQAAAAEIACDPIRYGCQTAKCQVIHTHGGIHKATIRCQRVRKRRRFLYSNDLIAF